MKSEVAIGQHKHPASSLYNYIITIVRPTCRRGVDIMAENKTIPGKIWTAASRGRATGEGCPLVERRRRGASVFRHSLYSLNVAEIFLKQKKEMITKGLFSSASQHWSTPKELYRVLEAEFNFNDDPCPLHSVTDGLYRDWETRVFLNPPYGREITKWLRKAYSESQKGKLVVCLLPSRTDTKWWHDYCMQADEIRFLRGRLKFGNSKNSAPFPSAVVIFRGTKAQQPYSFKNTKSLNLHK